MKRKIFRKTLGLVACAVMLLGMLANPAERVRAAETGGCINRANSYNYEGGYLTDIVAFASEDAGATIDTILPGETFAWQYGMVLEYNAANGTFAVVTSDMVSSDGVNAAAAATLGYGRLAVIFHGDVAGSQPESFEYFTTHAEVGTEYYLVGDYNELLTAADALSEAMYLTTEKPETYWTNPDAPVADEPVADTPAATDLGGCLHRANSYNYEGGYLTDMVVFASADTEASIETIMGAEGSFGWQYGLVFEYKEDKGCFVVTLSDMETGDGVNGAETAALSYGRLAVIFHGDVAGNQPDSFAYFTTHAEVGTEYYLVGDYDAILSSADVLNGVYLTTEKPESYWTPSVAIELPEATPVPEVTLAPTATPTPAIESSEGSVTRSNSYDWNMGWTKDIVAFVFDDEDSSVSTMMGEGTFAWQYGLILEYNEEKGTFTVIEADMDPTDGTNYVETTKLGYGKLAIIFHGDVAENQPDSFAFFTTHADPGTEYYLVGDYDNMVINYDKLKDTYFTTEKPENYWTKPEATPTPEPTATPVPTEAPTKAPVEPVIQEVKEDGINPIVIAVIIVAVAAAAGAAVVVVKKRGSNK